MKLILIDDEGDPLGMLALELAKEARVTGLEISKIFLVWPSHAETLTERLQLAVDRLKSAELLGVELKQPKTKDELAGIIANTTDFQGDEACMLVSDLNMDDIALRSGNQDGNWLDPKGAVPLAIMSFLRNKSRYALFHSGMGITAETIASQVGSSSSRAFASRNAFDSPYSADAAVGVADEIMRVLSKTPIENIWRHKDTKDWFGGAELIKHQFKNAESTSNWNAANKVIGNVFSESAYTEPFHESLKTLAGCCFAGSYNVGSTRYPLRIGSVALIAFLAFHAVVSAGDAEMNDGIDSEVFWMNMPKEIAMRDFLKTDDAAHNRRVAVALYWLFCRVLDNSHSGRLESMEVMEDGFRLNFSWKTEGLFNTLRSNYPSALKVDSWTSEADEFSKPENTTSAFLALERWLAFSPGCVVQLSHSKAIDILSPSANGR